MYFLYRQYFLFVLICLGREVRSHNDGLEERIEEENNNYDKTERRFLENFNDEDWHVAHLKPADFESESVETRRADDKAESFDDKVKKYRSAMKNDAGRIEFISGDILPEDDKYLEENARIESEIENKKAAAANATVSAARNIPTISNGSIVTNVPANITTTKAPVTIKERAVDVPSAATEAGVTTEEIWVQPISDDKDAMNEIKYQATTPRTKGAKKFERRSDYVFSSSEYEDDIAIFDINWCPDAVEVIELNIDVFRPYDVECELSIQWRSLE